MRGGGNMMKQAMALQANMKKAQDEIANMEVTGESGGGMVKVTMTGKHEVKRVQIEPAAWWEIDLTYYGLKALSWTGLVWGLKPVPRAVMEETARADHAATIKAAHHAAHTHPEYSSLKKVMPAAAAIAVATATGAHSMIPRKAEGPAIHKEIAGMTHAGMKQNSG